MRLATQPQKMFRTPGTAGSARAMEPRMRFGSKSERAKVILLSSGDAKPKTRKDDRQSQHPKELQIEGPMACPLPPGWFSISPEPVTKSLGLRARPGPKSKYGCDTSYERTSPFSLVRCPDHTAVHQTDVDRRGHRQEGKLEKGSFPPDATFVAVAHRKPESRTACSR